MEFRIFLTRDFCHCCKVNQNPAEARKFDDMAPSYWAWPVLCLASGQADNVDSTSRAWCRYCRKITEPLHSTKPLMCYIYSQPTALCRRLSMYSTGNIMMKTRVGDFCDIPSLWNRGFTLLVACVEIKILESWWTGFSWNAKRTVNRINILKIH